MATPQTISIWLIFLSSNLEKLGNPFVLKMPIGDSVEEMLDEVWQCIPSPVRDLGATGLQLWRIKYPPRQSCSNTSQYALGTRSIFTLELFMEIINSSSIFYLAERLQNAEDITDFFKEDPEQKIQAFVRCPDLVIPKRESSSKVPSDALQEPRDPAVEALEALLPPREYMGPEDLRGREHRDNVFIGRPAEHLGYPNAIFDPDLAKLHYKLEVINSADNDSEALSPTELKLVDVSRDFLFNVIKNHTTENSYWGGCGKFFEHIFGSKGHEQRPIRTSATHKTVAAIPGVYWGIRQGHRSLPHVILEANFEKGRGDATMQCIRDYSESCYRWEYDLEIVKSTMFPAILIGLNGNSLEISTVLTLQRVVVNELLILNLTNTFDRSTTVRKLVRIASALAECAALLENRYRPIIQQDLSAYRPQRFVPHPTPDPRWPPSSPLPTLTFVGRLNAENRRIQVVQNPLPHQFRSLFVAKLVQDRTRVEVVVKFTANYNEQAHRILADEGLAPKLYACRRVIGNLFMVVMERLEGTPMSAGIQGEYLEDSVFDDIRRAIGFLQRHDLVHGDLRAVNIVLDPNQAHAKLVDFDWAGKSGIDRYSLTINKSELADEWHPAVVAGGPMEADHDVYALDEVLIPKFKFGVVKRSRVNWYARKPT
ncbi:hypothetical protein BC826DRAFT_1106047 [Russula brevipes]|nr:hypothetical protein BC826DRAFT_1106047 [Russula brevipes]